jgi:hypothetical protein
MKKELKIEDQKWRKNVKRSINKFFYFVAALPFLSSIASAEEPVTEKTVPSFEQGHAVKESEMTNGYNASARIDVNGAWDVFINGSYILWQPKQSGLGIAVNVPVSAVNQGSEVKLDFDYHSGFKVAFGTNLNHDNWMAIVEYTRLHTRDHVSASADGVTYNLFSNWEIRDPFTSFTSVTGHWNFGYDMIDLSFGRPCYVGTHLTFKPFFGLRGGWIDQHLDSQCSSATNLLNSWNKSDSWLVGPRAGVGMNWLLGAGFRMLANAAGSLNYQEFKDRHTEVLNNVTRMTIVDENHVVAPNMEGDLGLGWGTYFDNSNWHFDLLASYHFEVYWNQNDMRRIRDEVLAGSYSKPGTLGMQGLTVTAQLDF